MKPIRVECIKKLAEINTQQIELNEKSDENRRANKMFK